MYETKTDCVDISCKIIYSSYIYILNYHRINISTDEKKKYCDILNYSKF